MTDQCIVCLNDLEVSSESPPLLDQPVLSSDETAELTEVDPVAPARGNATVGEDRIACLIPCTHTFHDACLRLWVERCNSCPICRQTFSTVNIVSKVGGSIISSYEVRDRIQIADVDLPPWMDDGEEPSDGSAFRVCDVCAAGDHGDCLIICDGCDMYCHTFCVGLQTVPVADWFCRKCTDGHGPEATNPNALNYTRDSIARRMGLHDITRRRTDPRNASSWSHSWRVIFRTLNIDMPSRNREVVPFSRYRRASEIQTTEEEQRADFRRWQRMYAASERQGGRANRFQETLPLLERERGAVSANQSRHVEPKAPQEERAWKDLEEAQEMDNEKKRKRSTQSPEQPAEQTPERKLKRPTHRRAREVAPASGQLMTSASTSLGSPSGLFVPEDRENMQTDLNARRPSFLQSVLDDVESPTPAPPASSMAITVPTDAARRPSQRLPFRMTSSASSSPALPNDYSSPGAASSPLTSPSTSRPGASLHNTSRVERALPGSTNGESSISSTGGSGSQRPSFDHSRFGPSGRMSRGGLASTRSTIASPLKRDLSIAAKENISTMVKAALKPFYHRENGLSSEEYTAINRDVSRFLYDLVGDVTEFDANSKRQWEAVAAKEVQKAVENLQK